MKHGIGALVVSIFFFSALSCSVRTTDLTDSKTWPENQTGEISRVLVVGVSGNHSVRNLFEKEMQARLEKLGVSALRSLEKMPRDAAVERSAFEAYFSSEQIDAILVSMVDSVENVGVYSEGLEYSQPPVAVNSYYDYYTRAYYNVSDPGHFEFARILRVESNLFDVGTEKLIWQCHSKSFSKDNAEKVINELANLIAKALKEDGVVK